MTDAGCNTSFRQRQAVLRASEAYREKHGIVLRFQRPKPKPAPLMPFAPGPDCFLPPARDVQMPTDCEGDAA